MVKNHFLSGLTQRASTGHHSPHLRPVLTYNPWTKTEPLFISHSLLARYMPGVNTCEIPNDFLGVAGLPRAFCYVATLPPPLTTSRGQYHPYQERIRSLNSNLFENLIMFSKH